MCEVVKKMYFFFPSVCTCWKKKEQARCPNSRRQHNEIWIHLSLSSTHASTDTRFHCMQCTWPFFPPCSYKCCSVPCMCFSSLTTDISLLSSNLLKVMFNTSLMFCQLAPAFLYELLGSLMNIKHWFIGENGGWSHYAIMQIAHRHYLLHW